MNDFIKKNKWIALNLKQNDTPKRMKIIRLSVDHNIKSISLQPGEHKQF